MPAERTTMRRVREVLRLTTAGVGLNEIVRRVGVAPSTVRLTLKRLTSAGLSWPLPAEITDTALEMALFAAAGTKQGHRCESAPKRDPGQNSSKSLKSSAKTPEMGCRSTRIGTQRGTKTPSVYQGVEAYPRWGSASALIHTQDFSNLLGKGLPGGWHAPDAGASRPAFASLPAGRRWRVSRSTSMALAPRSGSQVSTVRSAVIDGMK